jgi:hypothetical protein
MLDASCNAPHASCNVAHCTSLKAKDTAMSYRLAVLALVTLAFACKDSTAPAEPTLVFTFTPNPAPTVGLAVGCAGGTTPEKTWNYTLNIRNTGNVPFAVTSGSYTLYTTGAPTPVTFTIDGSIFTAAFGSGAVPANGQLQAPLCTRLSGQAGAVAYSFTGTFGTFTTPTLQLLP